MKRVGLVALALFIASIPLANWTLDRYGFVDVPWLGAIASGVVWVGLAFVARDVVQLTLGKAAALAGIAIGVVLSVILADPGLAAASAWAFLFSEIVDFGIYTPLVERGRFVAAVLVSSVVGSFIDSALFLRIAFGSYDGWWQLGVAKSVIVCAAAVVAWQLRRRVIHAVPRYQPN